jgi:hypothetical protein
VELVVLKNGKLVSMSCDYDPTKIIYVQIHLMSLVSENELVSASEDQLARKSEMCTCKKSAWLGIGL